ncbi:MAG: hypothetical protein WBJ07_09940, partial [Limnochordia bacterium]
MRKQIALFVIALVLAIGLAGCQQPGEPGTVAVRPDNVTINLASGVFTVDLTATVTDEEGNVVKLEAGDLTWEIADAGVAAVAPQKANSAVLEGKQVGETKLTVKYGDMAPA